jgi:multiple sugar transport system ATP-binding protein
VYANFAGQKVLVDPGHVRTHPRLAEYKGREIVLGMRPESFEVVSAVSSDVSTAERTIEVGLDLTEQLGSEAFVHFELASRPVVTPELAELMEDEGTDVGSLGDTSKFTARVDPDHAPSAGSRATLFVDSSRLHFFDPDTGLAIR